MVYIEQFFFPGHIILDFSYHICFIVLTYKECIFIISFDSKVFRVPINYDLFYNLEPYGRSYQPYAISILHIRQKILEHNSVVQLNNIYILIVPSPLSRAFI